MEEQDYRHKLREELSVRKAQNPRYSLRSFAQLLKVSPSFLSKVLNGQKNLSPQMALNVAFALKYNELEAQNFCQLVQKHNLVQKTQNRESATTSNKPQMIPTTIDLKTFDLLSERYYLPILELSECAMLSASLISKRLKISEADADTALKRLVELRLLVLNENRYSKSSRVVATPTEVSSEMIRKFHSQMIDKAKWALDEQSVHVRDITGITIPFHSRHIKKIKSEIRKFRLRMAALAEKEGSPCDVYQLNIQFFRLTHPEEPPR